MSAALPVPPSVWVLAALGVAGLWLPGIPGAIALFPLLGIAPGLLLAEAVPMRSGSIARWALALAASPLLSCVLAWALLQAGLPLPVAARVVALGALLSFGALAWVRARRAAAEPAEEGARFAATLAILAGFTIAFVMLVNPWIRVRGDAWVHGGIVWQILERGIPPEDPRFAGLSLQYVWLYNFFVAMLCSLEGGDPFVFMSLANAATMVATLLIAWLLGRRLWGGEPAARGVLLLSAFGFNAGMWLLWPLRLVRALVGHDRGVEVAKAIVAEAHWRRADVIFSLSPPFSYMVSFLDKFLHGSALAYAYLMLSLYLWAAAEWLEGGARGALLWAGAAACGMLLFHGVVGLSAIPVAIGALALAHLLRARLAWLPAPERLWALIASTLAGALLAVPYTLEISRGWPAEKSGLRHSYFGVDPYMLWTLLAAVAVALWLARRPIRAAFAERRPAAAFLVLFAGGMLLFNSVVSLPIGNSVKFIYQSFVPIAALGGSALAAELAVWSRRLSPALARVLFAAVFLGAPAITVAAYLADADGRTAPQLHPTAAEAGLYAWMIRETPRDAVFVDARYRDLLMVLGRRQLLLGSTSGPERAAFPLSQVLERREVMADLYGGLAHPERDVRVLERLGRPAYVLVRAADDSLGRTRAALERGGGRFRRAWDRDGLAVYRVTSEPESAATPPMERRP